VRAPWQCRKIAEYAELSRSSQGPQWEEAACDKVGRLAQGHSTMPTGSETMHFIPLHAIPKHIKPTYLCIVAAWRPEKEKPFRIRYTVGGDRIIYDGNCSTKTAELVTAKLLFNSVLSTPNARFGTLDIVDYYLNTPMEPKDYAYMRIALNTLPPKIVNEYKLEAMATNGYAYVEIRKGMYGLKQAGKLANDQLITHLAQYGYHPTAQTAGLWRHETRPIMFTLVVDDFGIQYENQADWDHLVSALEDKYKLKKNVSGDKYIGLSLEWDYEKRTCDISMPGYIERALQRFSHPHPNRPQHSPHAWQKPEYGAKTQLTPEIDHSKALDAKDIKHVQEVLGTLLYHARAVDSTMLTAIGTLASQQANGTQATMRALTHLLNYCATNPEATVQFTASDMILHVESDASYLSETKARSRAAGYHYLSSHQDPNPNGEHSEPPINGAITIISQIMKEVLSSAAEAELAALFYNCKEACSLRTTLEEMGYPQPPTPVVTDNSTAVGIANDTVKQRRSKAIDMRFYWVADRVKQNQFLIYWKKGSRNRADYFSKHHSAAHHKDMRDTFLHTPGVVTTSNHFDRLQIEEERMQREEAAANLQQTAIPVVTYTDAPKIASLQHSAGEGVVNTQGTRILYPAQTVADGTAQSHRIYS
jgi:Reverse transcriptase (RNA-dependent DNA polymerase)